jgi:hypothetical protein
MTKTLASLAAAVAVGLGISFAASQASAMVLGPEVRSTFHGHVATANIAPVAVNNRHLVVGGVIPERIILHPVPHDVVLRAPELANHRFVVVNDQIHVVHPETRAVVVVVDRH